MLVVVMIYIDDALEDNKEEEVIVVVVVFCCRLRQMCADAYSHPLESLYDNRRILPSRSAY